MNQNIDLLNIFQLEGMHIHSNMKIQGKYIADKLDSKFDRLNKCMIFRRIDHSICNQIHKYSSLTYCPIFDHLYIKDMFFHSNLAQQDKYTLIQSKFALQSKENIYRLIDSIQNHLDRHINSCYLKLALPCIEEALYIFLHPK